MTRGIQPGFPDPPANSQRLFRSLLAAMAEPGSIRQIDAGLTAGRALNPASRAIALSLCDFETPVWLAPGLRSDAEDLAFHCGCPFVSVPAQASLVFATADSTLPPLTALQCGDSMHPERGATLVIQTAAIDGDGAWHLSGPGIGGERSMSVAGLTTQWLEQRIALQDRFPAGVDVVLTCGHRLIALPRTTSIREASCTSR